MSGHVLRRSLKMAPDHASRQGSHVTKEYVFMIQYGQYLWR